MAYRKFIFIFGLIILVCGLFTACNWENPVMKKWWVDDEEPDYITIIKSVPIPEKIYETIVEKIVEWQAISPSQILQSIEIIGIDYIIFSGDSREYNGNSPTGGTDLTSQEKTYNDTTIKTVAKLLADNDDYLIMFHGHANPVTFAEGETVELSALSEDRAKAVVAVLQTEYEKPGVAGAPLAAARMNVSWYGGEKTLFGNSSPYQALNRRVELILFRIKTTS